MAVDEHGNLASGEVREFAFKCRNCGMLETADHAAEQPTPAACRNCGHGVLFDSITGIKSHNRDNWIVLADDDEAAAYVRANQIDANDVIVRHTPWPSTADRPPSSIERTADDVIAIKHETGGR